MIRWVALLGIAKGATIALRGDEVAGGLFVAGCVAVLCGMSPWVMAAAATVCSFVIPTSGSIVLFACVAAIHALLEGPALVTAIRSQVIAVYGFTVAHKIIGDFLSGDVIAGQLPWLPHPELAAVGVVMVEAFLAFAVYRRDPIALPVAVVAHSSFAIGMAQNPVHLIALGTFNLTMILLVAQATRCATRYDPARTVVAVPSEVA